MHIHYDPTYPSQVISSIKRLFLGLAIIAALALPGAAARASSSQGQPLNSVPPSAVSLAGRESSSQAGRPLTAATDLWVDAAHGSDSHNGLSPATAFRTLQKAASTAQAGAVIHVRPGVYRGTVTPSFSGSAAQPIVYRAENGPGTAVLRGSQPASGLSWSALAANTIGLPPGVDPGNVYYTDLSAWGLDGPPRFVVQLNGSGDVVQRLPMAREPDWQVKTEWKHHEFWWAADGGLDAAGCNPASDPDPGDCDRPSRSTTSLTDRTNDSEPAGIEPGNLTTLGDLTGATLVALDTIQGHYQYRRTIVAHDVAAGRVTIDQPAEYDEGTNDPALGWGSKYYVEGKPNLLDRPGEWWYDKQTGRLYLWPAEPGSPATQNIEISRYENGFDLSKRSYIVLDGLAVEFFDESAVFQANHSSDSSYGNSVRNARLRYAETGVYLSQTVSAGTPAGNVTSGFILENSEVAYMDTLAIYSSYNWENGSDPASFSRAGIVNTVIRNNRLHHLGFRSDRDGMIGAYFRYADRLRFEGNHVHHVGHNGVFFARAVVQSSKPYGFSPEEIKTGSILIKGNIFEQACMNGPDCGALKVWGRPPNGHVFRDVLIAENVFRNNFGWSYAAEKRHRWTEGSVTGMGGFGLYVDMASGVHVYRNIAYNNADTGFKFAGAWRDGPVVIYNNTAANSLIGIDLGGETYYSHENVDTRVANNILVNNEKLGIDVSGVDSRLLVDHNLYFNNGWNNNLTGAGMMRFQPDRQKSGVYFRTLAEIQANTALEDHGVSANPGFQGYDLSDHNRHDNSWPNFETNPGNPGVVDRGTQVLPLTLLRLLAAYGYNIFRAGAAYDIGHMEHGEPTILRTYLPAVLSSD